MLGLGFWEIVIVGLIALIVIGPERLPGFAKSVAKFLNEMKRTAADLKTTFDDEKDIFKENIDQLQKLKTDIQSISKLEENVDQKIDGLHSPESISDLQDPLHVEEQLNLLDPHENYDYEEEHFECEEDSEHKDNEDTSISTNNKDKA